MSERRAWKYYLTRDTNSLGQLSALVGVWYRRPIRRRLSFDKGYTWIPSDPDGTTDPPDWVEYDTGYYGDFTVDYCRKVFGTVPDTDRETVVCEQMVLAAN